MSFLTSEIWKKNSGVTKAVNALHSVLKQAKYSIVIYSKDLLDELYFKDKIIESITNALANNVKIVFLYNQDNENNLNIRQFLERSSKNENILSSKNENILSLKIEQNVNIDFLVVDKQYIRIEFDRENHSARFLDKITNEAEIKESKEWVDMIYNFLQNKIIQNLENSNQKDIAEKLTSFITIKPDVLL
jgi:hypothetical protein